MLNQYKNIENILAEKKSLSATRIQQIKLDNANIETQNSVLFDSDLINKSTVEFHVYSGETWITGNHRINSLQVVPEFYDDRNRLINFQSQPFVLDIYNQVENLKLNGGTYRIAVNFFENLIGNYEYPYLRIDEISPDRTELRLKLTKRDAISLQQINNYIQTVRQTAETGRYYDYLLNFSRNQCVLFVNSVIIDDFLYVKLHEPLTEDIQQDFKCWVVKQLKPTYIDNINIEPIIEEIAANVLSGPNWQANYSYDTSTETG